MCLLISSHLISSRLVSGLDQVLHPQLCQLWQVLLGPHHPWLRQWDLGPQALSRAIKHSVEWWCQGPRWICRKKLAGLMSAGHLFACYFMTNFILPSCICQWETFVGGVIEHDLTTILWKMSTTNPKWKYVLLNESSSSMRCNNCVKDEEWFRGLMKVIHHHAMKCLNPSEWNTTPFPIPFACVEKDALQDPPLMTFGSVRWNMWGK